MVAGIKWQQVIEQISGCCVAQSELRQGILIWTQTSHRGAFAAEVWMYL